MFVLNITKKDVVVVNPGRILERDSLSEIRQTLEDLSLHGSKSIVIDFTGTEHVYYRVADILARQKDLLEEREGRLVLAGMSPYVSDIFTAVGYSDSFERYDNLSDAVACCNC